MSATRELVACYAARLGGEEYLDNYLRRDPKRLEGQARALAESILKAGKVSDVTSRAARMILAYEDLPPESAYLLTTNLSLVGGNANLSYPER